MTKLLTVNEFCEAVKIGRVRCWKLRAEGKISYIKDGKRIKFTPEHVAQFIAAREVRAAAAE